jgi:rhodanese-related sulfurtransferase
MASAVTEIPAAEPDVLADHFGRRLALETDCWDVHEAMRVGDLDFVLLDVRGPKLYAKNHVPGAVNLPHGKITKENLAQWSGDVLFVVYCAGPHCNGSDRAAVRLGRLGRRAKVMIGGMTGWASEGFAFEQGSQN